MNYHSGTRLVNWSVNKKSIGHDNHEKTCGKLFDTIYEIVRRVPSGRVSTYGQIATLAGISDARKVGYAMNSLERDDGVPWHRVINSRGKISLRDQFMAEIQRQMLESEGIVFEGDSVDLCTYLWDPQE